jgi:hypothetical protein
MDVAKTQHNLVVRAQIKAMHRTIRRYINIDTKEYLEQDINKNGIWAVKKKLFAPEKFNVLFDKDQLNQYFSFVSNAPVTVSCPSQHRILV